MIRFLFFQSSVIGDLKAESGGGTIWSTAIGTLIGLYVIYYVFIRDNSK